LVILIAVLSTAGCSAFHWGQTPPETPQDQPEPSAEVAEVDSVDDPPSPHSEAWHWLEEGREYFERKEFQQAALLFDQVISTSEIGSPEVECFGPAATRFAIDRLLGREVTLEYDPSQGRLDYYGRTLAYVWVDGRSMRLFNDAAVRQGLALEYTYDTAYAWQSRFMRAERLARQQHRGVWTCPRPGS
jgi:micrococcal nuclease